MSYRGKIRGGRSSRRHKENVRKLRGTGGVVSFEALESRTLLSVSTINTDLLTISGPFASGTVYGTPYTAALVNGVAVFTVKGDLNVPTGDTLTGVGHYPAELLVGNNVNIAAGAVIDFSGTGAQAGPGGGAGGGAVAGGGNGTGGASGAGGAFGAHGVGFYASGGGNGGPGGYDTPTSQNNGTPGFDGSPGNAGQPAFATISGAGQGGANGLKGFGATLFPQTGQGVGGDGGAGGGYGPSNGGNGTTGKNGADGADGGVGGRGSAGQPGSGGQNVGTGFFGGAGGGSGGGGGGGGGGAGGQGGGGGGGGGAGGGSASTTGGAGGNGGAGGYGGAGGNGGTGNSGAAGGGGGGALEIYAYGSITVGGSLAARGAVGANGGTADNHGGTGNTGAGGVGGAGTSGEKVGLLSAGDGGTGGTGGTGGRGGDGGASGTGGNGGGGAGGDIELVASVLSGAGAVTTAGGAGGSNSGVSTTGGAGGNGRILKSAVDSSTFSATQIGSLASAGATPARANPFISGNSATPFIPGLQGGAEAFGLSYLGPTDFPGLQAGAPAFTGVALVREHLGGTWGPGYAGYDALFVVNLSGFSLSAVQVGAGATGYLSALKVGGYANDPAFGGNGPQVIGQLGVGAVFETLIPTASSNFNVSFQLNGQTTTATTASLSAGTAFYAQYTPLPTRKFVVTSLLGFQLNSPPYYTLFDAITDADKPYAGMSVITFSPGMSGTIQDFMNSIPAISGNVTVQGPGAGLITVDATSANELFQVQGGSFVTISGLTLTHSTYRGSITIGGAISVAPNATLTLSNDVFNANTSVGGSGSHSGDGGAIGNQGTLRIDHCSFTNNHAGILGGAIYNAGSLTVTDSTFAENSAGGDTGSAGSGGAIYNDNGAKATLINDTISGNILSSGRSGGGVGIADASVQLGNCIIAGNTGDVYGPFQSQSGNVIGDSTGAIGNWIIPDVVGTAAAPIDPLLAPLGLNGSSEPTFALLAGSPALDHGNNLVSTSAGLTTDERGLNRVYNTTVDAGAYEAQPSDPPANLQVKAQVGINYISWYSPVGADAPVPWSYQVYRSTTPGGEGSVSINTLLNGPGLEEVTDFYVSPGTTYYYQVTAVGPAGETSRSNEAVVVTPSPVINASAQTTVYLSQDANGQNIDWSSGNSSGYVPINTPGGLLINGDGGTDPIIAVQGGANPFPNFLHLNGTFTMNVPTGAKPLANTNIDIGTGTLYITSSSSSDPIATVKGWLKAGYNGGAWDGTPTSTGGVITSYVAASKPGRYAIGLADSLTSPAINPTPNSIELKFTLIGDTNLDGAVNITDVNALVPHYNSTGDWTGGDFNYDGLVNISDVNALVPNYNTSLASTSAQSTQLTSLNSVDTTATTQAIASVAAPSSASADIGEFPTLKKHKRIRTV